MKMESELKTEAGLESWMQGQAIGSVQRCHVGNGDELPRDLNAILGSRALAPFCALDAYVARRLDALRESEARPCRHAEATWGEVCREASRGPTGLVRSHQAERQRFEASLERDPEVYRVVEEALRYFYTALTLQLSLAERRRRATPVGEGTEVPDGSEASLAAIAQHVGRALKALEGGAAHPWRDCAPLLRPDFWCRGHVREGEAS